MGPEIGLYLNYRTKRKVVLNMAAKKIKEKCGDTVIVYAHIPGGGETLCQDRDFDRAYWMSDIYDNLKNKPLGKIVYPGSHEAGAYHFTDEKAAGSNDILHKFRINSVENYRRVQKDPVDVQLESGCRYFDFKIVRAKNNNFHCQHSYVAESFSNILNQIKRYLDKGKALNKRELIILSISAPSNNTHSSGAPQDSDKRGLRSLIERIIGEYLYIQPFDNAQKMKYSSFFNGLKPCVLLCGSCYEEIHFGEMACARWPNSSNNRAILNTERASYDSYLNGPARDVYRMYFTSTYQLIDEFIPGNHQLNLTLDLNRKLCLLEDILLKSIRDGRHLINILYLDSPAASPATVYARNMNLRIVHEEPPKFFSVQYRVHVDQFGWLAWRTSGETAGTAGTWVHSLKINAIEICLKNADRNASVEYEICVQNKGWREKAADGHTAGITGQWMAMEALRIHTKGLSHLLLYRVHSLAGEWSKWAKQGEIADSSSTRTWIDAVQIASCSVRYKTHFQKEGWLSESQNGATSGFAGKGLRMEAIEIYLDGPFENAQIEYEVHLEHEGWKKAVRNGVTAGATGKSLRLEAIKIRVIDFPELSVAYRVYVQGDGWMDWVKDREMAGTTGRHKRIEAIEIKLL